MVRPVTKTLLYAGTKAYTMATDRIPLEPDREDDDEPFVTKAEHLKEGMDKSHMPDEPESGRDRARRRMGRQDEERSRHERRVEEKAVGRMIERLREKGKSSRWIEEHKDDIRERVREELYG